MSAAKAFQAPPAHAEPTSNQSTSERASAKEDGGAKEPERPRKQPHFWRGRGADVLLHATTTAVGPKLLERGPAWRFAVRSFLQHDRENVNQDRIQRKCSLLRMSTALFVRYFQAPEGDRILGSPAIDKARGPVCETAFLILSVRELYSVTLFPVPFGSTRSCIFFHLMRFLVVAAQ
jgi:hypothetical protein